MSIITSRAVIRPLVEAAIADYHSQGIDAFVKTIHETILSKKIKFPVLEYAAKELYQAIPGQDEIAVTDRIIDLQALGGNVIAGYMLQLRLGDHFDESFRKAVAYIIRGNEWYVCDIIGERVMGHGLLTYPDVAIPELMQFAIHENKRIVRAIGVATHYAVKKGLKKRYARDMFGLLLQLAGTTDFHTKKGIGWAAKTIAKFHPDIIEQYSEHIEGGEVRQWFKTKIKIGLGRTGKYAHRYTG